MAVRHRSGKWVADWRTADGTRKRRYFRTKAEAESHLALEKLRAPKSRNKPSVGSLSFGTVAKAWADAREPDVAGSTAKLYRRAVKLLTSKLGEVSIGALDKQTLRGALISLRDDGYADATVSTLRTILGGILKSAVEDGLLSAVPPIGRFKHDGGRKIKALNREQLGAFITEAGKLDTNAKIAAMTLALTGIRAGELLALKWSEVALEAKRLRIVAGVSQEDGLREPKSKAGKRTVPIVSTLAEALKTLPREGFVVWPALSRDVGKVSPLAKRLYEVVKGIGERIGVKDLGPHALRHTFASQLIARGTSIYAVSRYLGHSRIGITLDRYGSHLPPEQEAAVESWASEVSTTVHTPATEGEREAQEWDALFSGSAT